MEKLEDLLSERYQDFIHVVSTAFDDKKNLQKELIDISDRYKLEVDDIQANLKRIDNVVWQAQIDFEAWKRNLVRDE